MLLVNAAARRARTSADSQVRLRQLGVDLVRTEAVTRPSDLPTAVGKAAAEGCRLLIAGGGDGTIGTVAGALARLPQSNRPVLGVLPLGTANDFARTLGLPADAAAACDVLADGKVVDVDLGWAASLPFLNVASLGLSVAATRALRPRLKRVLGPFAYPVSALVAYRRHEPFGVRLEFPDGGVEPLALDGLLAVAVGNGRHYGGGQVIAPDAGIDDHALDVYAIRTGRLRDHVNLARLLRDGTVIEHEDVQHVVTRALRVVTAEPLPVNLDGEVLAETPLTFSVQRNAVEVVVPPHVTHVRHDAALRVA